MSHRERVFIVFTCYYASYCADPRVSSAFRLRRIVDAKKRATDRRSQIAPARSRRTGSLFAIRFYSQGPGISRGERETRGRPLARCFRTSRTPPAGYGYMFGVVATGCCRRQRVAMPMVRWSPEYRARSPVIMRILPARSRGRVGLAKSGASTFSLSSRRRSRRNIHGENSRDLRPPL